MGSKGCASCVAYLLFVISELTVKLLQPQGGNRTLGLRRKHVFHAKKNDSHTCMNNWPPRWYIIYSVETVLPVGLLDWSNVPGPLGRVLRAPPRSYRYLRAVIRCSTTRGRCMAEGVVWIMVAPRG